MELQSGRGSDEFERIADALNEGSYAECRNLTALAGLPPPSPPAYPLPAGARVYVDYAESLDSNAGSEAAPLKTLAAAVEKAANDGHRSTPVTGGTGCSAAAHTTSTRPCSSPPSTAASPLSTTPTKRRFRPAPSPLKRPFGIRLDPPTSSQPI